ncbi:MAG: aminoacyl-tRNA hydrolase, partial [Oscillospiraceae bacterium]
MFFKSNSSAEYLIVGLGNPEKKYDGSRHNVGFEAVDFCAEKWGIQINKSKFNALYGQGEVKGVKVILQKPLTYMNNSGDAVGAAAQFFKIPAAKVIILNDDISLAPGRVRMREKGSAGGHNGLKSIISRLGEDFIRIKIGVGEKPNPEYDLAAWV